MSKIEVRITKKDGTTLNLSNRYIKNINIKKDQVQDYKFPVFSSVAQTGSISFNDSYKTIYKAIQNEEFETDTKVEVYLKNVLYGTYFMSNPDYDANSYTFTIQVSDNIAKLNDIKLPEIPMKNVSYDAKNLTDLQTIFNKFKINLSLYFANLDIIVMPPLSEILVPNGHINEGTAREQLDKILFLCSSVAYCRADGSIAIESKYSYNTNKDYIDGEYYYILKKNMLSNVRSNIFKQNSIKKLVVDGYQTVSEDKNRIFDFTLDLTKLDSRTPEEISSLFPELKCVERYNYNYVHESSAYVYSNFNVIRFYTDIEIDSSKNQFYKFDTLCEIKGYTRKGGTELYQDDQTRLVVENGEYVSTDSIILPNIKIRFVPNSLWENGNTNWSSMNYNEYIYGSYNRKKIPKNGYIDIIRLNNNTIRMYCQFTTDFNLAISSTESWNGETDEIKLTFNSYNQVNNQNINSTENNTDYIGYTINAIPELFANDSLMPYFYDGYYDVYAEDGMYMGKQWVTTGTIPEIINRSVFENFKDGLLTAEVSVMLSYYPAGKIQYNIYWENGERLEVGNKVVLMKNNKVGTSELKNSMFLDKNGEACIFEIVSIDFIYEGYPKFDLQLLEIRKDWYDKGYLGNKYR